ncbi:hypothetical protein MCP_1596 [Methanocella paludicola SANAE]|uniref:Metallopeptidase domain-containing protein n=1 Tax=Methanocella paludicola (strain DSM 17711 / JCM 13418 / NBRC 101707 / SANAE) TaxID=304371 RepID=D1YYZ6_METPS|nr:VWA-like domain-containing protein [Methanocella paludicola]BAI61668.1 hypothetical protein MCP_1596 [Methanocella paludicola SANAE]
MQDLTSGEKITKGIVHLQQSQPFFCYLVMHLEFKEGKLPTIGVDHKGQVHYNPAFVDSVTDKEVEGLIIHEALHYGLCHMIRMANKDKRLFNIAADMVVNDILLSAGMKLPACGILPKNHTYKTMLNGQPIKIDGLDEKSAEEVYEELMLAAATVNDDIKNKDDGKADSSGQDEPENAIETDENGRPTGESGAGLDEHIYISEGDEAEASAIEANCKEMMVEARNFAVSRGALPMGIERLIEKLLPPKVDWRILLRRAITNKLPFDFTYRRPGKKSIACGTYLPSVIREGCDVIVAIDTSPSIDRDTLTRFMSEAVNIGRSYHGLNMTLLCHSAAVEDSITVSEHDIHRLLEWKPKGGSGTSHVPVWEWINKNKPTARLVVCLTDGETDFGERQPYEVIWVLSPDGISEKDVPFGWAIKIPN